MNRENIDDKSPPHFIDEFYKNHLDSMQRKISFLEDIFIKNRDEKNIPIYMTRSRVKSYNSAYLKTKRKNKKNIEEITDLIGIRVICLFEQEIFKVYKYLLEFFNEYADELSELIIYHSELKPIYENIFNEKVNKDKHKNIKFKFSIKTSGYQSIHITGYLNCEEDPSRRLPFELQLRTLLQDVWGEIEHKLSYKHSNSSYFEKDFQIFSRNLETNDMFLSNLYEKSNSNSLEPKGKFLPQHVFNYDTSKFPIVFKDEPFAQLYNEYKKYVYDPLFPDSEYNNMIDAEKKYLEILILIYRHDINLKDDKWVRYWIEMEKAFFYLCPYKEDNNISDAKCIYMKYWEISYIASFRLGQIKTYNGKFIDALKFFDHSIKLINKEMEISTNKKDISLNKIKIHTNIALIYWLNEDEYPQSIISEINQAVLLFEENESGLNITEKNELFNSASWYYMEALEALEDEKLNEYSIKEYNIDINKYFDKYFKKLILSTNELLKKELEIKKELVTRETIDSIAMCYHTLYKRSRDKKNIENAHKYIKLFTDRKKIGFSYYDHEDIFREHFKQIECEYNKAT